MKISLSFDQPFFGRVSAGLGTECSVLGNGRKKFQFKLLLDNEDRKTCGVEQVCSKLINFL